MKQFILLALCATAFVGCEQMMQKKDVKPREDNLETPPVVPPPASNPNQPQGG